MNNLRNKAFAAIGMASFLALPAGAFAATLSTSGQVDLTPTITATTGSSSVTANGTVNVGAGANAGADTSSSASDSAQIATPVMITASDAASSGTTLSSSAQVATNADFTAYARGQMKSNPTIQEVDANGSSVTVKYHENGRFIGIIPVTMTSSATVDAAGNVSIAHPWYYFLTTTSTDNASLKAALSTESAAMFNQHPSVASEGATSTASAQAALTANEQAQLLAGINLALASALTANANTSGSASAY